MNRCIEQIINIKTNLIQQITIKLSNIIDLN